jgi:hypothetical protein
MGAWRIILVSVIILISFLFEVIAAEYETAVYTGADANTGISGAASYTGFLTVCNSSTDNLTTISLGVYRDVSMIQPLWVGVWNVTAATLVPETKLIDWDILSYDEVGTSAGSYTNSTNTLACTQGQYLAVIYNGTGTSANATANYYARVKNSGTSAIYNGSRADSADAISWSAYTDRMYNNYIYFSTASAPANNVTASWSAESLPDSWIINQSEILTYYFQIAGGNDDAACHIDIDGKFYNSSYGLTNGINYSLTIDLTNATNTTATENVTLGAITKSASFEDGTGGPTWIKHPSYTSGPPENKSYDSQWFVASCPDTGTCRVNYTSIQVYKYENAEGYFTLYLNNATSNNGTPLDRVCNLGSIALSEIANDTEVWINLTNSTETCDISDMGNYALTTDDEGSIQGQALQWRCAITTPAGSMTQWFYNNSDWRWWNGVDDHKNTYMLFTQSVTINTGPGGGTETVTLTEGDHNVRLTCGDTTGGDNNTYTKILTWDTTNPTITGGDNNTIYHNPNSVNINFSCSDANTLWSFQYNISYSNGSGNLFSAYTEDINTTAYTYDTPLDMGAYPNGTYNVYMECWDSHTAKKIDDFLPRRFEESAAIDFNTGPNWITIKPTSKAGLKSFETTKMDDRYIFYYDFRNKVEKDKQTYSFIIDSVQKIMIKSNSKYKAHLITSSHEWLDFELIDLNSEDEYIVTMLDEYSVMVTIKTYKKELTFKSIGQLNRAQTLNSFRLGNTPPYNITIIQPSNQTKNTDNSVEIECNALDDEEDDIYYQFFTDEESTGSATTLRQNTTANNYTLNPGDLNHYFKCKACNIDGVCSADSETRWLQSKITDLFGVNISSTASIMEMSIAEFEINLTFNELKYSKAEAGIILNNTVYDVSSVNLDTYSKGFSASALLPSITAIDNQSWYWNINLTYINGSIFQNNTFNGTLEVYPLNFSDCTDLENETSFLNLTFGDEWNATQMDNESVHNLDAEIILYNGDPAVNKTYNFDLVSINNLSLCLNPTWAAVKMDSIMIYDSVSFGKRYYYDVNTSLTNNTLSRTLYLLSEDYDTPVTLRVTDELDNEISTAYISIYHYYPELSKYLLIAMARTNIDGEDLAYLRKNDALYKYVVTKNEETIYTSPIDSKIIASDDLVVLRTSPQTFKDLMDEYNSLSILLFDLENNQTFHLIATDTEDKLTQVCMKVVHYSMNATLPIVCDTCTTSNNIDLTCDISKEGPGDYAAIIYAEGSPLNMIRTIWRHLTDLNQAVKEKIGLDGLVATFLITGTLALASWFISQNPIGIVIGAVIGFGGSYLLGLVIPGTGTTTAMVMFLIISTIMIILMGRRTVR